MAEEPAAPLLMERINSVYSAQTLFLYFELCHGVSVVVVDYIEVWCLCRCFMVDDFVTSPEADINILHKGLSLILIVPLMFLFMSA